ncbi:CBS domain containing-hemolysin-like protein [Chitinophaga dinghuensis]|uniref:CBS domain containing-hemolysin-like protein n=1 Tax=Chitinophaga dinghuensis TaxID=1539050 RepID=A0A327VZ35_9BACT|nr:hemolysin family protein [Chitinophaga dinghuensis]RAJ82341.1 CBS domain containing-hemolysin-like protein [Chitinophaga dinghuensis]
MFLQVLGTIILVLLNGFFVAAEFAIVKVRSSQINASEGASKRATKAAKHVLSNLDGYLAATQLGITLASLGLGWVGESVVTTLVLNFMDAIGLHITESAAHAVAIPVAFFIITVLHIVFGELAPKSMAIRKPLPTTLAVAMPLRFIFIIFRPFIWLLNGLANSILRLFGLQPAGESEIHSEEELKLIISESQEGGAIEETERELIQNVFEFDDSRVKEIFTHRKNLSALDISLPFDQLVNQVITDGYSRYPVYDNTLDELKGVIYTKDLVKGVHEKKVTDISQILKPVYYVPDSMKIKDLLRTFQLQRIQMAVVTNEFGDTEGIVTMEDILEELVGDIQDEHDHEAPIVEKKDDITYIVNAHENLSDINEHLPYPLPESEHYETLSGLINYVHGNIPREGDVVRLERYEVLILKMFRSSVEKASLKLLSDAQKQ